MAAENFTYTGSPWGYTAPGWTVFQRSPGISPKVAESMMPYFRYTGSANDPVRFVYVGATPSGARILSQSLDCGLRWYDESRGHDYFAHVFVENNPKPLPAHFNPMSLFMSGDLKTAFPADAELRKKALDILKGVRAKEEPPPLSAPDSIFELKSNKEFENELLFVPERIPPEAVAKLASVAAAIADKVANLGGPPILFDAANPNSKYIMAAALALLPPVLRHAASFTTFAVSSELGQSSPVGSFAFVGTIQQGRECDPDTGIIGKIEGNADFTFSDLAEVEKFARIADTVDGIRGIEAFYAASSYFKVLTGRVDDQKSFDEAARLARNNPRLQVPELTRPRILAAIDKTEYTERLAAIGNVDDAIRFIKEMSVLKFKGADMSKDVVDRLDFSMISESDALKLVKAFKAEGLSDDEVFGKAVASASAEAVRKLHRQLLNKEKELRDARRTASLGGIGKMAAATLVGVLAGALLCGFFVNIVSSHERDALQAELADLRNSKADLETRVKALEKERRGVSSRLEKAREENTELKEQEQRLQAEVSQLKAKIGKSQETKANGAVEISSVTSIQNADTTRSFDAQTAKLKEENNELRQKQESFANQNKTLLDSNTSLSNKLEKIINKLASATNMEVRAKAAYLTVQNENEKLVKQNDELARQNEGLKKKNEGLKKKNDEVIFALSNDPKARDKEFEKRADELKKKSKDLDAREKKVEKEEKCTMKWKEELEKKLNDKQEYLNLKISEIAKREKDVDQRDQDLKQREKVVAEKESGMEEEYNKKKDALQKEYERREKDRQKFYDDMHRELDQKSRMR